MKMKYAVASVLFLVLAAEVAIATPPDGKELFEPNTGAAITIPVDWVLAADQSRLIATSDDQKAMVVLMKTETGFEQEIMKLESSFAQQVFKDTHVDEAIILVGEDRGGFEAAVALKGHAIHRRDGQPVQFAAIMVKSGDSGSLVIGAWKDQKHVSTVRGMKFRFRGGDKDKLRANLENTFKEVSGSVTASVEA